MSPKGARLGVWVRSGGRCAICKTYLLESEITAREVSLGELAHNVGRTADPRSPRGANALPLDARDDANNLMLLCGSCHGEIDAAGQADTLTVERIGEIKEKHEAFIRHVTGLDATHQTVVIRALGRVRGTAVELRQETAAAAVLASSQRYPFFLLSPDRQGIEIDLRQMPLEDGAGDDYYRMAVAKIDEAFTTLLRPAAEQGNVPHLSVFAFLRLPLLVHLGSRLDDTIATDLYQRHRAGESWTWDVADDEVAFTHRPLRDGTGNEAVVLVNVSGTIHADELPNHLTDLPLFIIEPVSATPDADLVRTRATLSAFERTVRAFLSHLESKRKHLTRLHVLAAAPVSAAITLGRCVAWGIHPSLAVYDRNDGSYELALEVTHP